MKSLNPIILKVKDFEVTISPVNDYLDKAERLTNSNGIEATALVCITTQTREQIQLEEFKDFMEELIYVFRLVTGNLVDWYYAESVDERTNKPIERIHKYAVTGPYSNTVRFRPLKPGYQSFVPKLDLESIVDAFFETTDHSLAINALKILINQFTNACDGTSYIESQGLLASTLTELISSKYAHSNW